MRHRRAVFRLIALATTTVLFGFEVYSLVADTHYKWDFLLLMVLLWSGYFLRERLAVHPLHFALFAGFLVLHNLGTFGAYAWMPLGVAYDTIVHTYFGLVAGLVLYRAFTRRGPYRGWKKVLAVVIVVLAASAWHEIVAYIGAVAIEGAGWAVRPGGADPLDTHKDMRNDLIGGLIAVGLYGLYSVRDRLRFHR